MTMWPMTDSEVDASARAWYESAANDYLVSEAELERMVRSHRGRWMVVEEHGGAYRHRRLSQARKHVRMCDAAGIRAHVRRWQRGRVVFEADEFVVTDARWLP